MGNSSGIGLPFIADLLSKAISEQEDELFKLAQAVENDPGVTELECDWEIPVGDGLEER